MSSRGPLLVQIHRHNLFQQPAIREVLEKYLWDTDPDTVMSGECKWLDEYHGGLAADLVEAIAAVDPTVMLEVSSADPECEIIVRYTPELGAREFAVREGEIVVEAYEVTTLLNSQPDDLMGELDSLIGSPYQRAFDAIPADDPNRLTRKV